MKAVDNWHVHSFIQHFIMLLVRVPLKEQNQQNTLEWFTSCDLDNQSSMAVSQWKGQESRSCSVYKIGSLSSSDLVLECLGCLESYGSSVHIRIMKEWVLTTVKNASATGQKNLVQTQSKSFLLPCEGVAQTQGD